MDHQSNENSLGIEKSEVGLFFLLILVLSLVAFSLGYYLGVKRGELRQASFYHSLESKNLMNSKKPVIQTDKKISENNNLVDQQKITDIQTSEKKDDQVISDSEYPFEIIGKDNDIFKGKWCVLVGSFERLKDAKDFAAGFVVRGHDPLIRESLLEGVGILYKVSLGNYETQKQAEDFIKEEESLFAGLDYPVEKID